MGMVQMMDNAAYDISIYTAPDQLSPKIINGEIDIAAIPSNLGAVLYNKLGGGIKVVGVNTMGVLYILENGDSVSSIEDLAARQSMRRARVQRLNMCLIKYSPKTAWMM